MSPAPRTSSASRHTSARTLALACGSLLAIVVALGPSCRIAGTQIVATGLSAPMFVTAPVGDARLFIVERAGTIRILQNGSLLATPFLDIRSLVSTDGEGGLLGLAFSPEFASNRQLFVMYANLAGDIVVARVMRSVSNPNRAVPSSLFPLLTVDPPAQRHKGGTLAFSPDDGFLYVGIGDGGNMLNGRDPNALLGKLVRLNVAGGPTSPYTIPSSNPFVGPDGVRDEIWAFGFRNPFRWSFDRATGDLWIADVGQNQMEELDFEPAGSGGGFDYGWPTQEGTLCFEPDATHACDDPQNPIRYVFPVTEYPHNDENCSSITGGVVFRGRSTFHTGKYYFGDYCSGQVWSYGGGERVDRTSQLGGPFSGIVAISEDGFGEVYITELDAGRIRRIE